MVKRHGEGKEYDDKGNLLYEGEYFLAQRKNKKIELEYLD